MPLHTKYNSVTRKYNDNITLVAVKQRRPLNWDEYSLQGLEWQQSKRTQTNF